LVRDDTAYRPDPANLLGLANTKEKQMARFVLVHGGFSGAWIWLPLMDRLKADGHVVEAFDLPGMGNDNSTDSRRTHLQALGE
jgi:alpha-beta hydrolase superfamily lysophospholipase